MSRFSRVQSPVVWLGIVALCSALVAVLPSTNHAVADRHLLQQKNADRFTRPSEWTGTMRVQINYDGPWYTGNPKDSPRFKEIQQALKAHLVVNCSVNATGTLKRISPEDWTWDVASANYRISGSVTSRRVSTVTTPDATGKESVKPMGSVIGGGGLLPGNHDTAASSMQFSIDPEADTYSVSLSAGFEAEEFNPNHITEENPKGTEKTTVSQEIAVENLPLPKSGLVLSGSKRLLVDEAHDIYATVSWSFSPGNQTPPQLILEPKEKNYDTWIPFPVDKPLYKDPQIPNARPSQAFTATLKPGKPGGATPRGRIDFMLTDVTRHKGECANYPRAGKMKDDLRFAPQSRQPSGIIIDSDTHAHTEGKVTSAVVVVESLDTGAFGNLRAECRDLGVQATNPRTRDSVVAIPKDDNHNQIADGWEATYGIAGRSYGAEWDGDDQPKGTQNLGDALSLYEEYRGFVVKNGNGTTFRRFSPWRKQLFVIDDSGFIDPQAWQHASDIELVLLTHALVDGNRQAGLREWRIVDYLGERKKYCVWVQKLPGVIDTEYPENDPSAICSAESVTEAGGKPYPKETARVRMFPDRIASEVEGFKNLAQLAIDGKGDPYLQQRFAELAAEQDTSGDPVTALEQFKVKARAALTRFPSFKAQLIREYGRYILLHELSHACGIAGHIRPNPETKQPGESGEGNQQCPMCRTNYKKRLSYVLIDGPSGQIQPLLGHVRFCGDAPDTCLSLLNVKDE